MEDRLAGSVVRWRVGWQGLRECGEGGGDRLAGSVVRWRIGWQGVW